MTESEFRQKVMPLRRQMYGLGLRMGISPDDTADAVQETAFDLLEDSCSHLVDMLGHCGRN